MPSRRHRRRRSAEDDIEYGIRSTRRRTTYENRGSSSLYPEQFMAQEILYEQAEIYLHFSLYLGQLLSILVTLYIAVQPIIVQYERMGARMAQAQAWTL